MKKILAVTGILMLAVASRLPAEDRTGMLGLQYTVGPSFIAGGSDARDAGTVEPGVGGALQFGLMKNIDFVFAYDYLDADLRTQALTFGGNYRFAPLQALTPFAGAGLGFGKPFSGEDWGHFSLKLTGGLEKSLTDNVGLAGVFTYQYVEGPDPFGSVHAIEPGVRLTYYFGRPLR